jgi:hypothetical protein
VNESIFGASSDDDQSARGSPTIYLATKWNSTIASSSNYLATKWDSTIARSFNYLATKQTKWNSTIARVSNLKQARNSSHGGIKTVNLAPIFKPEALRVSEEAQKLLWSERENGTIGPVW